MGPDQAIHVLDTEADPSIVIREVMRDAKAAIWRLAAKHQYGTGLQAGVDAHSFAWLKRLRKVEAFQEAGILETVMTAGVWDPLRCGTVFEDADPEAK